ncbi:hypothetical protein niasHT_001026 [Heterodera trifolii]|uniref:Uncharacterized protein n=1 Tax=Heterodera trifolii TaxID=157864 RepID=A0ABD2LUV6_9BILA
MSQIVWEFKSNNLCAMPCSLPKICYTPVHFTAPDLCLNPGTNPNSFQHFVALSEHSLIICLLIIFIGGFALGLIASIFFRCMLGKSRHNPVGTTTSARKGARDRAALRSLNSISVPHLMATSV